MGKAERVHPRCSAKRLAVAWLLFKAQALAEVPEEEAMALQLELRVLMGVFLVRCFPVYENMDVYNEEREILFSPSWRQVDSFEKCMGQVTIRPGYPAFPKARDWVRAQRKDPHQCGVLTGLGKDLPPPASSNRFYSPDVYTKSLHQSSAWLGVCPLPPYLAAILAWRSWSPEGRGRDCRRVGWSIS